MNSEQRINIIVDITEKTENNVIFLRKIYKSNLSLLLLIQNNATSILCDQ